MRAKCKLLLAFLSIAYGKNSRRCILALGAFTNRAAKLNAKLPGVITAADSPCRGGFGNM
jgi:hypothetical protein